MRARKAGPILALLGGLACQPREPLPTPAVAAVGRARSALRRARVEAAREAGPLAELERAVAASALLERRLAEERSARFGPSHAGEIERLALAAETAAWNARLAARREAVRRRAGLDERRAGLAERLSAFAAEVEHLPGDQPLRAEFQATRLGLAAVAAAGERGDLTAADHGLETAAAGLARVEALLAAHYARLGDPDLRRRWQEWVDATVAESRQDGTAAVIVDKRARRCFLLQGGRVVDVFTAELGRAGLADKTYAGDAATPEGRYRIVEKKEGEETSYHRALALDYPTAADRREFAAARRRGLVPAGRGIGGSIEIHGHGGRGTDWTNGCVALPDTEMDRLFAAVEEGTPVTLVGTADLGDLFPGRGARRPPR
ncbi:MAG TPA: L,D-transpeptidase [Thermoanaerobaculia bacterium]|nr:L,D-transpeptidase [Thermoanaerobaculia bacterium]